MRLKEALSVLSNSSPYAVSTERNAQRQSLLDEIKSYLYIQMPIEIKLFRALVQMIKKFYFYVVAVVMVNQNY